MDDARLHRGHRPDGVHRARQPLQAVAHDEEHIRNAAVLQLGQHRHPELRRLTVTVAGQHPQDVLVPVHVDPDRGVHRPVTDLPVADLDHNRVDEHRRVHRLQLRDEPAPSPREPALTLTADEALLFRFSALTYNAHRIHYDHNWVREEGYGDLVVHGPLQALMMGELVRRLGDGLVGKQFAYRLVSPMIGPQTFTVLAGEDGVNASAEVRDVHGTVTAVSTICPNDPTQE